MERFSEELLPGTIILILIGMIILSLLKLINMFLTYQLKKTMLEKGLSESFMDAMLSKRHHLSTKNTQ